MYADSKRGACENAVEVRDSVLLRQEKENKFSTMVHLNPFPVIQKTGNTVYVQSLKLATSIYRTLHTWRNAMPLTKTINSHVSQSQIPLGNNVPLILMFRARIFQNRKFTY